MSDLDKLMNKLKKDKIDEIPKETDDEIEEEEIDEEDEEEEELDEEEEEEELKPIPKKKKKIEEEDEEEMIPETSDDPNEQSVEGEVAILQNNGIYRRERLMIERERNLLLNAIAHILSDALGGKNGNKKTK